MIQQSGIPLTPAPPALGRGEPILTPLTASDKSIQVSHKTNGWWRWKHPGQERYGRKSPECLILTRREPVLP